MKAKKFDRKLTLKRETIACLGAEELNDLRGGATLFTKCGTYCYCPITNFTGCC